MTSRSLRFTVILSPEQDPAFPGYYNAIVPALPGCVSYGTDKADALQNIREAIEAYLEDLEAEGEEIPEDEVEPVLVEV
jgi:predicted RNase H-like HicB family nuclease